MVAKGQPRYPRAVARGADASGARHDTAARRREAGRLMTKPWAATFDSGSSSPAADRLVYADTRTGQTRTKGGGEPWPRPSIGPPPRRPRRVHRAPARRPH